MKQSFWNTLKCTYHIRVRMCIQQSRIQTILKKYFLTFCKDMFHRFSTKLIQKQTFYLEFNHVKFQEGNIFCFWDKYLNELPMSVNITCWSEELSNWDCSLFVALMYMTLQKCSSGLLNDFSRLPTITGAFWTQDALWYPEIGISWGKLCDYALSQSIINCWSFKTSVE